MYLISVKSTIKLVTKTTESWERQHQLAEGRKVFDAKKFYAYYIVYVGKKDELKQC